MANLDFARGLASGQSLGKAKAAPKSNCSSATVSNGILALTTDILFVNEADSGVEAFRHGHVKILRQLPLGKGSGSERPYHRAKRRCGRECRK